VQKVLIASDVDPVEIVLWLPALCHKMDVPYVIVKGKALLGRLTQQRSTSCACVVNIRPQDKDPFEKLIQSARKRFNDRHEEIRKQWGGRQLGLKAKQKAQAKLRKMSKNAKSAQKPEKK